MGKIFEEIQVPQAVYDEVTVLNKLHSETIKSFLKGKMEKVGNHIAVQVLRMELDLGEAESIVLALEKKGDILIDDFKGRRAAKANGLKPIRTVGVLLRAKKTGFISEIKPLLDNLINNKIRIAEELYNRALYLAGED
ncbi:MAG: DUF3368 domain-containing protein [Candidatus Aminicenantes bacterium]|nr:DUF3368 domain-containing protein [Candidatus Aminicenantes bacterium]